MGDGESLVILHGLFGSLDNWMTLAKKLSKQFEVFVVDARNHGQSPHADEFNYQVMADDLYEFLITHQIVDPIILGHSMGGKTAMQFAMNYPNKLSQLIVVDIAPKPYPVHHHQIIEGLLSLNFNNIISRKEADEELSKTITELSVRQFLLKNLYWKENKQLAWRFNLAIINKKIEEVGEELQDIQPLNKPTLFIRGQHSNYILISDEQKIKEIFPLSTIKTLNAGHWIHAEKPQEFLELISSFIST